MSRAGRFSGRRAQAAGARTEAQVQASVERYARGGLAYFAKQHPPFIGKRHAGRVVGSYREASGSDFAGVVRGGVAAFFEVKTSGSPSLPLSRQGGKPSLSHNQRAELRRVWALGGVSGVLVRVVQTVKGKAAPSWWWLTFAAFEAAEASAKADCKKSIGVEALRQYGERLPMCGGGPDFLPAMIRPDEGGRQ